MSYLSPLIILERINYSCFPSWRKSRKSKGSQDKGKLKCKDQTKHSFCSKCVGENTIYNWQDQQFYSCRYIHCIHHDLFTSITQLVQPRNHFTYLSRAAMLYISWDVSHCIYSPNLLILPQASQMSLLDNVQMHAYLQATVSYAMCGAIQHYRVSNYCRGTTE